MKTLTRTVIESLVNEAETFWRLMGKALNPEVRESYRAAYDRRMFAVAYLRQRPEA